MDSYYDLNYRPFLPSDRNAAILDIGCGEGDLVRYLCGLGYTNITAVDIDAELIERLQDVPHVKTIVDCANGDFIRALKGQYDLIVAKQMIYYLERTQAPVFVKEIRKKLAADGQFIVEIFNGSMLSSRLTEAKDPGILTAYTEHSIARLLSWNGFRIEACFGFKAQSRGIKFALYSYLQKIWFLLYRALLILERGRDDELPTLYQKTIIAVAKPQ